MPEETQPGSPQQPAAVNTEKPASVGLLDRIVAEGKIAKDESQRPYARSLVSKFASFVTDQ